MSINFIFLSGLMLSKMAYCSWKETGHSLSSDDEMGNYRRPFDFRFKMTMKEENQLIDQLIKNKDYALSESVLNKIKKEIEYFDETKDTPPEHEDIWKAMAEQDLKAIDYLIRIKQIDPNSKLEGDWTLLHWASNYGNLEMTKYLVSKGADINARNIYSNSPLHWACVNGKLEIVKYFISELKMDPNSKGYDNETCLYKAVCSDNLELVIFLVENGAKKSLYEKNNSQNIPLDYAEYWHQKKELIEYLKSQMN